MPPFNKAINNSNIDSNDEDKWLYINKVKRCKPWSSVKIIGKG